MQKNAVPRFGKKSAAEKVSEKLFPRMGGTNQETLHPHHMKKRDLRVNVDHPQTTGAKGQADRRTVKPLTMVVPDETKCQLINPRCYVRSERGQRTKVPQTVDPEGTSD